VDGSIRAAADGAFLDADGDGTAGGLHRVSFTTVSHHGGQPAPQLTRLGKVVDPGPDLEPMTFDDIRRGADGVIHTADDEFLNPIAGARVWILGQEQNVVFTDADGNFELPTCRPATSRWPSTAAPPPMRPPACSGPRW
jgi:hypothetical protein